MNSHTFLNHARVLILRCKFWIIRRFLAVKLGDFSTFSRHWEKLEGKFPLRVKSRRLSRKIQRIFLSNQKPELLRRDSLPRGSSLYLQLFFAKFSRAVLSFSRTLPAPRSSRMLTPLNVVDWVVIVAYEKLKDSSFGSLPIGRARIGNQNRWNESTQSWSTREDTTSYVYY